MKLALLLLTLILATAQANLGAYKNGKFIFPDTNKPYTGNLDVLNNDWGKDAVEFNRDYVDGIIQGTEKSYYQSGKLKSVGFFSKGRLEGFGEYFTFQQVFIKIMSCWVCIECIT